MTEVVVGRVPENRNLIVIFSEPPATTISLTLLCEVRLHLLDVRFDIYLKRETLTQLSQIVLRLNPVSYETFRQAAVIDKP